VIFLTKHSKHSWKHNNLCIFIVCKYFITWDYSSSGKPGSDRDRIQNFWIGWTSIITWLSRKFSLRLPERCIRRASTDTGQWKRRNSYFQSDSQMQTEKNISWKYQECNQDSGPDPKNVGPDELYLRHSEELPIYWRFWMQKQLLILSVESKNMYLIWISKENRIKFEFNFPYNKMLQSWKQIPSIESY